MLLIFCRIRGYYIHLLKNYFDNKFYLEVLFFYFKVVAIFNYQYAYKWNR